MNGGSTSMFEVIIIGAGFAGLGMAIRLKSSGWNDFRVIEKAPELVREMSAI